MLNRAILILLFLLSVCIRQGYSIADRRTYNYSEVDNHVLSYRGVAFSGIRALADSLTGKFTEDHEKARAIYRWITDNISYDCYAYHNPDNRTDNYQLVLESRKAVCSGYASLFKALCRFSGLDAEIITGYARFSYEDMGRERIEVNHAWNAVKIDGEWQLVDATWGSGYTDESVNRFTKSYSDNFFLTDPKQFVLNHFPREKKWQLLDRPVSKRKFSTYPYIWEGYYRHKVTAFAPKKGVIEIRSGQAVRFRFKVGKNVKITTAALHTGLQRAPQHVEVKHVRQGIRFDYVFPQQGEYYISLALNSEHTIVYKVIAR